MYSALLHLFEEIDPVTKADLNLFFNDMISVNAQLRGHGFGEMIATIIKAVTFAPRQDSYEDVHKAYLKAYDNEKYLEVYGKEEKENMMMAEGEKEAEEEMMMAEIEKEAEGEMMMPDRALIEVDEKAALLGPSKEKKTIRGA